MRAIHLRSYRGRGRIAANETGAAKKAVTGHMAGAVPEAPARAADTTVTGSVAGAEPRGSARVDNG